MTDWTTPEDVPADTVDRLHRWLLQEGNPEDAATPGERAVADIIRTFWPVPAPTIAEELREQASWAEGMGGPVHGAKFRDLATRAEQMERDLAEARAEVKSLVEDLAGAESEVERLAAERDRLEAAQRISDGSAWGGPVREPCTESQDETVTAPSVHNTDRLTEHSDATVTDPADVKPGEAWQVLIDGIEPTVGFSANGTGWCCYRSTHGTVLPIGDERITLVSRLVPAPRVITTPDEFDRLAEGAIVRGGDGHAWENVAGKWCGHRAFGAISTGALANFGPVTVLWEPGE
jgi:hypothetical protein